MPSTQQADVSWLGAVTVMVMFTAVTFLRHAPWFPLNLLTGMFVHVNEQVD